MLYHGQNFGTAGPGQVKAHRAGGTEELSSGYDNPDLPSHSPDGFQCGYNGSGPAQLAAALLNDVFDEEIANEHYQAFKSDVISKLDAEWKLTDSDIRGWYHERQYQSGNSA